MNNLKNIKLNIIPKNNLESINKQYEQGSSVEWSDNVSVNAIRSMMNDVVDAYSTCYTSLKDNFIECVKKIHEQREKLIADVESSLVEIDEMIDECERSYRSYQLLNGSNSIDMSNMEEKRAKLVEYRKHLDEIKENYYAKQ